jgi:hypothetical protein
MDNKVSKVRNIMWMLGAKQCPNHACKGWIVTCQIIEDTKSATVT